ncbi:MAG: LLM class flavin-dependent oxidoreductase [Micromonosporaceae bacterium]|nr:LLM class flavin-dependent oxidoreductase [Micromonosporaceae bacterium]
MSVLCAVGLPNVGEFGDPRVLVDLATAAEEHGWDGVFLWDHVLYHQPDWPVANPTVALAAIAARTERVRLGPLMTALPRRRAQVAAREVATLDALSGGRVIFGAALGSMDAEYSAFGESASLRDRAGRLEESLAALDELWRGREVRFRGRHVVVDGVRMAPTTQRPRPPIWCAGRWPARSGFRRAARWDGVMPTHADFGKGTTMPPAALREALAVIAAERGGLDGFDVALEGRTAAGSAARTVASYAAVGLTWWVEAMGWWRGGVAAARARILTGPPRL